jgi:DNA polymerase elongation subunit (family B)
MTTESKASTINNPLVRALARWENEGGSIDADWKKRVALIQEEDRILHCLGAAVIMRWNNLPTEVQRELFTSAASLGDPLDAPDLKEQIARFLHTRKDL